MKRPTLTQIATELTSAIKIAKTIGFTGDDAIMEANRMVVEEYKIFDIDPLRDSGRTFNDGDFHKDCEIFKAAIKDAVKAGKTKPTFNILAIRRTKIKNWTTKYSESIITDLKEKGEIITKEGRRNTQYYLQKPLV